MTEPCFPVPEKVELKMRCGLGDHVLSVDASAMTRQLQHIGKLAVGNGTALAVAPHEKLTGGGMGRVSSRSVITSIWKKID